MREGQACGLFLVSVAGEGGVAAQALAPPGAEVFPRLPLPSLPTVTGRPPSDQRGVGVSVSCERHREPFAPQRLWPCVLWSSPSWRLE